MHGDKQSVNNDDFPWKHISLHSSFPFLHCSSNVSSPFLLLKISQKYPWSRFSEKCPLPLYMTPLIVYCLSMYILSGLLVKFRFKYDIILNWWDRGQEPHPPLAWKLEIKYSLYSCICMPFETYWTP